MTLLRATLTALFLTTGLAAAPGTAVASGPTDGGAAAQVARAQVARAQVADSPPGDLPAFDVPLYCAGLADRSDSAFAHIILRGCLGREESARERLRAAQRRADLNGARLGLCAACAAGAADCPSGQALPESYVALETCLKGPGVARAFLAGVARRAARTDDTELAEIGARCARFAEAPRDPGRQVMACLSAAEAARPAPDPPPNDE